MADVTFDFGVEYDFTDTFKVDIIGAKGDKGDTGSVGPKGDTGDTGPKGDSGVQIVDDMSKVEDDTNVVIYTADTETLNLVEEDELTSVKTDVSTNTTNISQLSQKITDLNNYADGTATATLKEEIVNCLYIDTDGYICLKEA